MLRVLAIGRQREVDANATDSRGKDTTSNSILEETIDKVSDVDSGRKNSKTLSGVPKRPRGSFPTTTNRTDKSKDDATKYADSTRTPRISTEIPSTSSGRREQEEEEYTTENYTEDYDTNGDEENTTEGEKTSEKVEKRKNNKETRKEGGEYVIDRRGSDSARSDGVIRYRTGTNPFSDIYDGPAKSNDRTEQFTEGTTKNRDEPSPKSFLGELSKSILARFSTGVTAIVTSGQQSTNVTSEIDYLLDRVMCAKIVSDLNVTEVFHITASLAQNLMTNPSTLVSGENLIRRFLFGNVKSSMMSESE